MKFDWVRELFIVLVRYPVHTLVRTPMYGLTLNQSNQRIRSIFQSVYNKRKYQISEIAGFYYRPIFDVVTAYQQGTGVK